MRKKFSGTGCEKPDKVGEDNVPPGKIVPTIRHGNGTFIDKISDEAGSYKKCEKIEELVDLSTKTNQSMLTTPLASKQNLP